MIQTHRKVIHVELLNPPKEYQKHCYFGSVAAIYETLPKEIVGVSKQVVWNLLKSGSYRSRKAIIRHGILISKQSNRGQKK